MSDTIVDKQIAWEVAKQLLKIKAVTVNTKKPYRYVSGILAPLYTDNRLLISHPSEWKIVIQKYIEVIKNNLDFMPDYLSGTATAAIPHAAAIAYQMEIPMVYVRSSKKEHGKENLIEGDLKPGSKVLVIEDLVSTGKSITQNVSAIRESGGIVTHCLAITTSTVGAFVDVVKELNIQLLTLTNIQTVIETAISEKYITDSDGRSVNQFLASPKSWGHEMGFE
jgi:orotate phosphoribosyltransferase